MVKKAAKKPPTEGRWVLVNTNYVDVYLNKENERLIGIQRGVWSVMHIRELSRFYSTLHLSDAPDAPVMFKARNNNLVVTEVGLLNLKQFPALIFPNDPRITQGHWAEIVDRVVGSKFFEKAPCTTQYGTVHVSNHHYVRDLANGGVEFIRRYVRDGVSFSFDAFRRDVEANLKALGYIGSKSSTPYSVSCGTVSGFNGCCGIAIIGRVTRDDGRVYDGLETGPVDKDRCIATLKERIDSAKRAGYGIVLASTSDITCRVSPGYPEALKELGFTVVSDVRGKSPTTNIQLWLLNLKNRYPK